MPSAQSLPAARPLSLARDHTRDNEPVVCVRLVGLPDANPANSAQPVSLDTQKHPLDLRARRVSCEQRVTGPTCPIASSHFEGSREFPKQPHPCSPLLPQTLVRHSRRSSLSRCIILRELDNYSSVSPFVDSTQPFCNGVPFINVNYVSRVILYTVYNAWIISSRQLVGYVRRLTRFIF